MSDDQCPRSPGPDIPFEIGLVMAGAISAGAYTAGVIDFLIEALDEWEKAKEHARANRSDPESLKCPMHSVKIKVMAGASAGGMTSGLATGLLGMDYESVTSQPPPNHPAKPSNNNLYRSWVNTIDIDPLLGTRDLDGQGRTLVQSVLDSSILRDIAGDAFKFENPGARKRRNYVAETLHVFLTVTNLRGIPYAVQFSNFSGKKQKLFEMTMHADNMHFILDEHEPPAAQGAFWLKPYDFLIPPDQRANQSWDLLQKSALATGAFPVGLAPILLERLSSQYDVRHWRHKGPRDENGKHYCEYWEPIPPMFGDTNPFPYRFLCVDGGVMNNEPLDLANLVLNGPLGVEPTDGHRVTRATIMILPFPNATEFSKEYDGESSLLHLLPTTFNSLISQARFKADELTKANDPQIYSRFLVVPRRGFRGDGTIEPNTIACGSLGGFGGFLSRRFREHDYQLGRRNCQWFLQQYFTLPSEGPNANALFAGMTDQARSWCAVHKSTDRNEILPLLPVIPLMGKAREPIAAPTWPTLTVREFKALRPKVKVRLSRVVGAMVDETIEGWFWGWLKRSAVKSAWWLNRDKVVNATMDKIEADLDSRGLLER